MTDSEIAIVRVEVARQQRERHHRGVAADTVLLLLDEIDRLRAALAEQRERWQGALKNLHRAVGSNFGWPDQHERQAEAMRQAHAVLYPIAAARRKGSA